MRVIVTFSGGKDSLAALLWTREHITKNFTTVFCDTGWEHPLTYEYIHRIADKLHLDLVTLKSKKYAGMVDLARQKHRCPSARSTVAINIRISMMSCATSSGRTRRAPCSTTTRPRVA